MRFNPLVPFRSGAIKRSGNGPRSFFGTDMDELMSRFFELDAADRFGGFADFAPSIDVTETDTQIILKADLPGVEQDDVHLELHDDMLTLKGERNEETEEGEGEDRRVVERSYGSFQRSMRLPFSPSEDEIETNYKKGVLTVKIAKPENTESAAKRIPIKGKWV